MQFALPLLKESAEKIPDWLNSDLEGQVKTAISVALKQPKYYADILHRISIENLRKYVYF